MDRQKNNEYDPTIDLNYDVINDYGTTSPFGILQETADTSSSIVVDWTKEADVDPGQKQFLEKKVYYKHALITDGKDKGNSLPLQMNIQYHEKPHNPNPVVLFIPGGGFTIAPIEGLPITRNYLANHGYAVVSAQYRVIGEGLYKDAVADVNDAIRYVKSHAPKYNMDPERIVLLGNSAGGYMVSLATISANRENKDFRGESNLEYSTEVKGVINLYGLSDLRKIADDYTEDSRLSHEVNTSLESHYVNGVYSQTSIMDNGETAKASNPLTYIDGTEPPFLFLHGDKDLAVSPSQTVILHEALLAAGVSSRRYSLVGATHGRGGFDSQPALDVIEDFLRSTLK
ncbi:alpha/beta hydrolase [Spirochaeta cellobiosiphila]|uniref:alpha/beta hydrolase n=1 Tax=Spirochaeta cellobiosiphila TaxID=504483 RepID=UPI00042A3550|nr:alpha/beta hydrolase [Spirochaeta cellobiosiphila]